MSHKKTNKFENIIKKKIFSVVLPLLIHMIVADGKITDKETKFIIDFMNELPKEGFTLDELHDFLDKTESIIEKEPSVYIENALKLLDKDEQLECLKILITASIIDKKLDSSEAGILLDVSKAFGLDVKKLIIEMYKE
jgi:uncharacterized tellurite resistance protein B-like protein